MGRWRAAGGVLAVGICLLAAAPAQAAKSCGEPGSQWQRATPAEAGMDAAKLQDALDYAPRTSASRCASIATAAWWARTAPPP
jgi:hypothetical protein